ncbi:hypothetical protein NQZ79_g6610 [Umbelopsis isabellina]|nr:hypothetical protein NQZ79_g6610 [Umbelopsis isabellina]
MSTPWHCLEANGVDVKLFQVEETLSDEVLTKMQAPAKPDIPVITSQQLTEPDGIILGIPTRFGIFPAQMKAFLDSTGKLWASGALSGKFVGTFFSTASQHGGQETTALNAVTYFAHHGMMYVPFGFANKALFDLTEVVGGSAYGAGTITNGDGSRQPSEKELAIAKQQGETFGKIVMTYQNGKSKLSAAEAPKDSDNLLSVGTATAGAGAGAAVAASQASTRGDPATSSTHTDVNVPVAGAATNTSTTANTSDTINKDNVGTTPSQPTPSQDIAAAQSSQPTDAPETSQQPGAGPSEKPKKKKKFFFCCGNPDDLD